MVFHLESESRNHAAVNGLFISNGFFPSVSPIVKGVASLQAIPIDFSLSPFSDKPP
jgi:hypothetical protein